MCDVASLSISIRGGSKGKGKLEEEHVKRDEGDEGQEGGGGVNDSINNSINCDDVRLLPMMFWCVMGFGARTIGGLHILSQKGT